jgi:hypothetical protein
LPRRARKGKQSTSGTGLAIAAVVLALAILVISGKTGRRIHVMERY